MTPAEVEAVLALWREVEGTRPERGMVRWYYGLPTPQWSIDMQCKRTHYLSDAQASDLICGHLRRWLEARPGIVAVTEDSIPAHSVPERRYGAGYIRPGASMVMHHDSTRLLALIAAVRAVAGTTGKTQTQGGASLRDANTTRTVFPGLGSATSYEVAGDLKRELSTGAAQMPGGQDDPNTPTAADAAGD